MYHAAQLADRERPHEHDEDPGMMEGVMERCPNCSTPARPGAKFCTTCGFRFPGDASDGESAQDDPDATAAANDDESGLFPGAMTDGWPSPPAPAEMVAGSSDEPVVTPQATPGDSDEMTEGATTSNTWAADPVDSWPMRPDVAVAATPLSEPDSRPDENFETTSVNTPDAAPDTQPGSGEATERAMRLLDELRQTISEIGSQSAVDLSGVVSDLQVAVTPPGAMAADDVAELRDALLAARERPRDIDTIVDLTKRIDAMLALVIAYDRAIAAIERSLEALRG
jgi:hypothetical protein